MEPLFSTILVDDSNPAIKYDDGWDTSFFNIANSSRFSEPPIYGTVHFSSGSNFSYSFNGSFIRAAFPNADASDIISCTVDNVPLSCFSPDNVLYCQSEPLPTKKVHELSVKVQDHQSTNPIFFDYLEYTPAEPVTEGDIELDLTGDTVVDGLDFDFVGYSIGVYAAFGFNNPHTPSPATYTIDKNPPVNFTIVNPTTAAFPGANHQIILQTPRLPLAQYHLRLNFYGNENTAPLNVWMVLVQNSTFNHTLEIVPPIQTLSTAPTVSGSLSISTLSTPSGTSPSFASNGRQKSSNIGIIIGCTISAAVVIAILLMVICVFRRRRRSISSDVVIDRFPNMLHRHFYRSNEVSKGQTVSGSSGSPRGFIISQDQQSESVANELPPAYTDG
ncbi:hypothetical protein GALMADRAFT_1243874 [Galerina marginata CBS 339.88]|uniref:Mid2 domain-containing protein n=1 Tax=Galerina marginata (strain CBS 339.88) TaxID=685588 RepID=A0A067TB16_GALM3|nr:hypothetical protein GALMADRAFT_1243874 [Galerina marginata CBS 339.88]